MTRGKIIIKNNFGKIITTYHNSDCTHDFVLGLCKNTSKDISCITNAAIIASKCDGVPVHNIYYRHVVDLSNFVLTSTRTEYNKKTGAFVVTKDVCKSKFNTEK